jgi:hypothetical protein
MRSPAAPKLEAALLALLLVRKIYGDYTYEAGECENEL